MNVLDLLILASLLGAGVGGFRLGFLTRVTSWIGLAIGLYAAARFLPTVVGLVDEESPTTRLILAATVLLGAAFVGQAVGLVAGSRLRTALPPGGVRTADRAVGALVGCLGVLAAIWLLLPAMADVRGTPAYLARTSTVARAIDSALPRPPDTLQSLRALVSEAGFPEVFSGLNRSPAAGPPPADAGLAPAVLDRVMASTVKIEGRACDRIQDGSGFVVQADTVVTNAHVIAGDRGAIFAIRPDGRRFRATPSVVDTDRDLAILKAPGIGLVPLPVTSSTAQAGTGGAVLGHPGGQDPIAVAPAKVSDRVDAVGRDLYNRRPTRRDVFILASVLAPGYSGGPFVNAAGEVAGVAFAIAPDRDAVAYALTDAELRKVLSEDRGQTVGTGDCLH